MILYDIVQLSSSRLVVGRGAGSYVLVLSNGKEQPPLKACNAKQLKSSRHRVSQLMKMVGVQCYSHDTRKLSSPQEIET